jgi:PTS system mannitol-specific IIC component
MTTGVLTEETIVLVGRAATRDEAISEAGELLVAAGMVERSYVDAMHAREASVSTHMGNLLAIPHGTNQAKATVRRTGLSFVRHREPVDWGGKPTEFVVGIAAAGDDHLPLLARIAEVFSDPEQVQRLRDADAPAEVMQILGAE